MAELQSTLGASIAAWGFIPKSTILTIRDVTQFVIRLPPDAPTAISTPSFPRTRAGVMLFNGYLPGAIELTRFGVGSYHIIPLFMTIPVPLGMIPDPNPDIIVLVIETALPSPSITARWVVPLSGLGLLLSNTNFGSLPSSIQGFPGRKNSGTRSSISCCLFRV